MSIINNLARKALNKLGYDLVCQSRLNQANSPLVDQLIERNITVVLDAGANIGQFTKMLRHFGYCNRIASFEPVSQAFQHLRIQADSDPNWEAVNLALGASSHRTLINVSHNLVSSSIRDLEDKTLTAEPSVEYFASEYINVEPLDNILPQFLATSDRPFLKVDVQGYENEVFAGANNCLQYFNGIILECSLSSLYKGEWLFSQVLDIFAQNKFIFSGIEPEFVDPRTGELLQVNALFWNSRCSAIPS